MVESKGQELNRSRHRFRSGPMILLGLHVVLISTVYVIMPRGIGYWTYLLCAWHVVNGVLLGSYRRQTVIVEVAGFTFLESVISFGIHLLAAMMGKRLDFGTIDSWPVVYPLFLFNLLFALAGSLVGWNIYGRWQR